MLNLNSKIIICRPHNKGQNLSVKLKRFGILSHVLPTFTIKPIIIKTKVNNIKFTDIIFTSTYAVKYSPKCLLKLLGENTINTWAIGVSTKQELFAKGIDALAPKINANSESVFQLMSQNQMPWSKREVLIVKGEKGRQFLFKTLKKFGAKVNMLECYQRLAINKADLINSVSLLQPKLFLFTSFDALRYAMHIFHVYPKWKNDVAITVTNSRMLNWANKTNFSKIFLLEDITEQALLKFTIDLYKTFVDT